MSRQLSSSQQVQRKAHVSLVGRVAILVPFIALAVSVLFSRSSFIGHGHARLGFVVLFMAAALGAAYLMWFRKAIAPRKSKGRAVKGKPEEEHEDNEDEDDEAFSEEQKEESDASSASASPAMSRSKSLSQMEELDKEDDTDRLARFWHPATPSSPQHAAASPAAAQQPAGETLPEPLYYLASTKYISSLSPADFAELYKQIEWRKLPADSTLYTAGDDSRDGIFIIVAGQVSMHTPDSAAPICTHSSGELIGEEAVFEPSEPRWLTCKALTAVSVIVMSGALLDSWKRDRPEMICSFIKTSLARQWRIAEFCLYTFLHIPAELNSLRRFHIPDLAPLLADDRSDGDDRPSAAQFISSLAASSSERLGTGGVLFSEGSHSPSHLFVVVSGELSATRADHPHQSLALRAGDVIDPLSFLADAPHHYTVTATSDVTLAYLTASTIIPRLAHPCLYALMMSVVHWMRPTLRLFSSLGLKLEWRKAGEPLFVERQRADEMFVIISGRVRVVSERRRKRRQPVKAPKEAEPSQTGQQPSAEAEQPQQEYGRRADIFGPVQYGRYDPTKRRHPFVRLELGQGDCCGETAFLSHSWDEDSRHSATAVCVRDSEVVRVSRRSFASTVERFPPVMGVLTQIVSARLEYLLKQDGDRTDGPGQLSALTKKEKCVCVALVPLRFPTAAAQAASPTAASSSSPSSSSFPGFARSLSTALSSHGSTLHLTTALVDQVLGSDTTANLDNYYHRSRFTAWLTEQENSHRFIVLQAEGELTAWTSLSVRIADYALLVADGAGSSELDRFEWKLMWQSEERKVREEEQRRRRAQKSTPSSAFTGDNVDKEREATRRQAVPLSFCIKDLVLVHPPSTALPSGTRRWFVDRPHLHTFHHVRSDLPSHYDRLARYLANKSVGFVLGGGGARGLAHQGVLDAAVELEVPIDFIGGTSQGSMMSGLFGQLSSHTRDDMKVMAGRVHEMARQVGSLLVLLSDATFPIMSYFSGRVFSDQLRAILGADVYIEDLWVKYFCISTNMSRGDIVVHTQGLLWQACRASMSILEYLPPMQLSPALTDLLIDGGYINNMPCDVLRDLYNPLYIVAVDVESKTSHRLQQLTYFGDSLNGWWMLWQKLQAALPAWLGGSDAHSVKLPSYSELISALLFIQHNRNIRQFMEQGVMDLYVRPQLGETQLLDYHKEDDIIARGYRSGKTKLTEWRLVQGHDAPYAIRDGQQTTSTTDEPAAAAAGGRGRVSLPIAKVELSRSQTVTGLPPATAAFSATTRAAESTSGGPPTAAMERKKGGDGARRSVVRASSSQHINSEESG